MASCSVLFTVKEDADRIRNESQAARQKRGRKMFFGTLYYTKSQKPWIFFLKEASY